MYIQGVQYEIGRLSLKRDTLYRVSQDRRDRFSRTSVSFRGPGERMQIPRGRYCLTDAFIPVMKDGPDERVRTKKCTHSRPFKKRPAKINVARYANGQVKIIEARDATKVKGLGAQKKTLLLVLSMGQQVFSRNGTLPKSRLVCKSCMTVSVILHLVHTQVAHGNEQPPGFL